MPPVPITAVVTVYNEAKHLRDLLDSLQAQSDPFDVVLVDGGSSDGTLDLAWDYAETWKPLTVIEHEGTRGECRNEGVEHAEGDLVAFIDGDCIANPFWADHLRQAYQEHDLVAGRTLDIGYWAFENLQRVELEHQGVDVTYPSCNLAYDREAFLEVEGFDARFVTAEDIDLNYRAVEAGYEIGYAEDAIVYHRARDSFRGFFHQAFWNGYGRKQLTLKHGSLWENYSFVSMLDRQLHFWGLARLVTASLGYMLALLRERGWQGG